MDLAAWLARYGAVFEHSPWVAEGAWRERAYANADELHRAMMRVVESAPVEKKLALVRAHPELAGGESLTVDSTSEQGRLGFNRLEVVFLTAAVIAQWPLIADGVRAAVPAGSLRRYSAYGTLLLATIMVLPVTRLDFIYFQF